MKAKIIVECDFGNDPSITIGVLQALADDLAGQCFDWNDQQGTFVGGVEINPKGCVCIE